ncbi:MAG: PD-(D/E)XK nuclease family protein [Deltaproteobacteria bacterium]|nr:PD-(D/E)XK nuclease family protein [Deltaproteobacteria bacterium]
MNEKIFSASELEDYLLCPYRFYARSILKLKPAFEWSLELTPVEIGNLIHHILDYFLKKKEASKKFLLDTLETEMRRLHEERPQLLLVLLERQKKRIARTLLSFLEQYQCEQKERKSLKPRYLEWAFDDLVIENAMGDPIRLRGRIDRIDVDPVNKRFLVIDYKTGSTKITGNQIIQGKSLQLPLYILAVQRTLLPDYEPIGALYYQLSDMTRNKGLLHAERLPEDLQIHPRSSSLIPAARWEETFQLIEERVRTIVAEIRKGVFTSHAEPCEAYCPYKDICKIRASKEA